MIDTIIAIAIAHIHIHNLRLRGCTVQFNNGTMIHVRSGAGATGPQLERRLWCDPIEEQQRERCTNQDSQYLCQTKYQSNRLHMRLCTDDDDWYGWFGKLMCHTNPRNVLLRSVGLRSSLLPFCILNFAFTAWSNMVWIVCSCSSTYTIHYHTPINH